MKYLVQPTGVLSLLSQKEADTLSNNSHDQNHETFRKCALAVLNSGTVTDNAKILLETFKDFEIKVVRNERGVKIELTNPPETAFVDGVLISSIQNNLYSVLRDIINTPIIFQYNELIYKDAPDSLNQKITDNIFMILRHAFALTPNKEPNVVVCWGGHSINKIEYDYAYNVGTELGLRCLDICTGCGPGAMEAPMVGAAYGHNRQHHTTGRFIGLTEPSIIAAEPPNTLVSNLVILPDIEQRLEAFVRFGSALIVFPGGPGTAEELLYFLSIKLREENKDIPLPLILTGPKESEDYFRAIDNFVRNILGDEVANLYDIIIDNPKLVASKVSENINKVKEYRTKTSDSYCFNWKLYIPDSLKKHFEATHENMYNLNLTFEQNKSSLAENLRSAFSGIVTGGVKAEGIAAIQKYGPYKLKGDPKIIKAVEKLLTDFYNQHRFLLSNEEYVPCYTFEE